MVNKINEIIESVNAGLDPAEVLAIVRTELENYYTKEEVDDLLSQIDLSLYYTKTEVDAIVSRIDGDVDALEGRMDTAEGDIDALETGKQDALTPVSPIYIAEDNGVLKIGETDLVPTTVQDSFVFENGDVYALHDVYVYYSGADTGTMTGVSFNIVPKGKLVNRAISTITQLSSSSNYYLVSTRVIEILNDLSLFVYYGSFGIKPVTGSGYGELDTYPKYQRAYTGTELKLYKRA